MPPNDMPRNGYGYLAALPRQTLLEDIDNEEWEIGMVTSSSTHRVVRVGTTYIDTALCDVWWSDEEDTFVAQVRLGS